MSVHNRQALHNDIFASERVPLEHPEAMVSIPFDQNELGDIDDGVCETLANEKRHDHHAARHV